jgi:hypothetical protein
MKIVQGHEFFRSLPRLVSISALFPVRTVFPKTFAFPKLVLKVISAFGVKVFHLMRLLGLEKSNPAIPGGKDDIDSGVALLVITCDSGLYAAIGEIVSVWKWTVRQQSEPFPADASGPMELSPCKIVIYDSDLTDGSWKQALMKLRTAGDDPCILLASRVYDQYLWNEVIRCGGFDVIAKSANREQMARTLRFAWFWKKKLQQKPIGLRQ